MALERATSGARRWWRILTEAQNEKELLARYGMVEPAPSSLAELEAIADEVLQQVRQLDGHIRFRFANNPEGLATWRSPSNIVGPPRAGGQADGRIEPAA